MQLSNRAFKNYFATLSTVAIPSEEDAHAAAISEVRSLFNNSSQIFGRLSASRAEFEKMKVRRNWNNETRQHLKFEGLLRLKLTSSLVIWSTRKSRNRDMLLSC